MSGVLSMIMMRLVLSYSSIETGIWTAKAAMKRAITPENAGNSKPQHLTLGL